MTHKIDVAYRAVRLSFLGAVFIGMTSGLNFYGLYPIALIFTAGAFYVLGVMSAIESGIHKPEQETILKAETFTNKELDKYARERGVSVKLNPKPLIEEVFFEPLDKPLFVEGENGYPLLNEAVFVRKLTPEQCKQLSSDLSNPNPIIGASIVNLDDVVNKKVIIDGKDIAREQL